MPNPAPSPGRHRWHVLVAIGGVAAVLAAVVVIQLLGEEQGSADPAADPRPQQAQAPPAGARVGGVEPRALDPANLDDDEYLLDPTRQAEFERAAAEAKDLAAELRSGKEQWSGFLIDMETSEESVSSYLACAETFLAGTCNYTIDYVVEPSSGGHGRVVYAKASATLGPTQQCETYAKCMARERLGLSVRIPPESEGLIPYRRARRENAAPALFDDPEGAAKSLEFLEAALFRLKMAPNDRPDRAYRIAELESQIQMFRTLSERNKDEP